STSLGARMPELPAGINVEQSDGALPAVIAEDGSTPYRRIADDLLGAIRCGALAEGDPLPTMKDLALRYAVAPSTVHRAITLLVEDGKAVASRGRRARVATS
ncbi:MAG: GntR family transcriptional regulator, partial [Pseudonocardia sp.]